MDGAWLTGYKRLLALRAASPVHAEGPVVVVAPHPDDETLACGGVIARSCRLGVPVKVVIMTDGSASHRRFMEPKALAQVRRGEASEALATLGLGQQEIEWLAFPDGQLHRHAAAAVDALSVLLLRERPASIFLPYRHEPPPDHRSTHRIALEALRRCGEACHVYEYPVWFLAVWPFVSAKGNGLRKRMGFAARSLRSGVRMLGHFNCSQDLSELGALKREAMRSYRSQMERPEGIDAWKTLADVHGGRFLRALLHDREYFFRYPFSTGTELSGLATDWSRQSREAGHL